MRIVILGPPGAGKGSLASLCHERLALAHLSTGALFREEIARRSPLGKRVNRYVSKGQLVPDKLVVEVMAKKLRNMSTTRFVLDGFPRTKGQAAGFDKVLAKRPRQSLDGVVYLTSPQSLLVRRLSGRRVCGRCGANYHLRTMRPARSGRCDRCKGELIMRKDDQPATIRARLRLDRRMAQPLLNYYREQGLLYPLDGRGLIGGVFSRALKLFRRNGWLKA